MNEYEVASETSDRVNASNYDIADILRTLSDTAEGAERSFFDEG